MILARRTVLTFVAASAATLAGCATPHEPDHAHSVFFAPDSDALDAPSRDLLLRLAGEIAADRPKSVDIDAFANRRDDGTENVVLAARRASAVAAALQAAGVDPRRMAIAVRGAAQRTGAMPLEGRRVDIRVRR